MVATRLMSDGLGMMAQARTAYLDATAAEGACGSHVKRLSYGDGCETLRTPGFAREISANSRLAPFAARRRWPTLSQKALKAIVN